MSRMNTLNKYRTKSKSFCHRKDYIYYDGYEFVIRIDKVHRQVKYFDRRNYSSIKTHQRNNEVQLCAVIGPSCTNNELIIKVKTALNDEKSY